MNYSNKKGFTLTETLISLIVILMIVILSYPLFYALKNPSYDQELSARQLFSFIQKEVNLSRNTFVEENKLQIIDSRYRFVVIEQYQDKVRRQVGGTGHEALLSNVGFFTITDNGHNILVSVEMKGGEFYQKKIHYASKQ
jgi:competence protein ComGF